MGYGVRGVSGEYHGPPNDAHITRVKEDPEAGIEAAAVEGKGGFRERTGWRGGGLEPVSSRSFCKPSRTCRSRCVRYRWWGNWSVDALGRCWSCRGLFLRVWLNAPPVAPLTLASLPQELPSVPPSFLAAPTSHPRPPRSLSLSSLSIHPVPRSSSIPLLSVPPFAVLLCLPTAFLLVGPLQPPPGAV